MKSEYLSAEQVIDDLGGKVAQGLSMMVARIRADLALYRRTFPGWVADSTDRGLLNWCHDRAWAHAVVIFDGVREVSFVDRPPTRELYVGTRYRLRVKKHDIDGAIATYLTQGALDFLEQEPATLDGLEEIRLIAGYGWDPELREVGAAVISLRDGHDKVIWKHGAARAHRRRHRDHDPDPAAHRAATAPDRTAGRHPGRAAQRGGT